MRKVIVALLSLTLCMSFAACGSVDESSAPAADSSQTTSDVQLESVTIRMDSTNLHEGVEFNDSELLKKTAEFRTKVLENAVEKEPDSRGELIGGDWLDIKCSEGTAIYYEAGEDNYVRIGRTTYYTDDDTAKEYKDYVLNFLEQGGYWGDNAVAKEQRCLVYKDSNTMHEGVQVKDTDFINWVDEYKGRVISSGTLVDEQGDDAPKGAYLKIDLNGVIIYATAPDWKWIGIGGDIYEVDESLVSELYDYVDGYFDNSSN